MKAHRVLTASVWVTRLALGTLFILLTARPGPVAAQAIAGSVTDAATARPLSGVEIQTVLDEHVLGSVVTDSLGAFAVYLRSAGVYKLQAVRLGYRPVESELEVGAAELVEVTLTMSIAPIELPGINIEARRRDPRRDATYEGLYARRATAHPVGPERVVVRGDPEMAVSSRVRDVFQWFVRPRGCVTFYVDGLPRDELLWGVLDMDVSMLEGIEYYQEGLWAPIGFEPGTSSPWRAAQGERAFTRRTGITCSVIAVWRLRPEKADSLPSLR